MSELWTLGQSVQGRALQARAFAPQGKTAPMAPGRAEWPWILCLGAVHGDEVEGVWLLDEMLLHWEQRWPYSRIGLVSWNQVNPDGFALGQRWNAANIDLNRNLPTTDWTPEIKNPRYPPGISPASEPENKALVALIEALNPAAILSMHSFKNYQVNANGPSLEWAECLSAVCGYPVTEDIGYPTPGSLGSYAGKERAIPTITLEIERGLPRDKVLELHVPVVEAALRYWEERLGKEQS